MFNKRLKRLPAIEVKVMRQAKKVKRMHTTWCERIAEQLEIEPVQQTLQENQMKWFQHMIRKNDERAVKWEAKNQENTGLLKLLIAMHL